MFEVNGTIAHNVQDEAMATAVLQRMPIPPNVIDRRGPNSIGILWVTKPHVYASVFEELQNSIYIMLRRGRWNVRRIGFQLTPGPEYLLNNSAVPVDVLNLYRAYGAIVYRTPTDPTTFHDKLLIDALRRLMDAGELPRPIDVLRAAQADNPDVINDAWNPKGIAAALRRHKIFTYKSNGIVRYREVARSALQKLVRQHGKPAFSAPAVP